MSRVQHAFQFSGRDADIPRFVSETDPVPMMLAETDTGGGVGLMPAHAAKLPHVGCVIVKLTASVIEAELFLILPASQEMESLVTLIKKRGSEH